MPEPLPHPTPHPRESTNASHLMASRRRDIRACGTGSLCNRLCVLVEALERIDIRLGDVCVCLCHRQAGCAISESPAPA